LGRISCRAPDDVGGQTSAVARSEGTGRFPRFAPRFFSPVNLDALRALHCPHAFCSNFARSCSPLHQQLQHPTSRYQYLDGGMEGGRDMPSEGGRGQVCASAHLSSSAVPLSHTIEHASHLHARLPAEPSPALFVCRSPAALDAEPPCAGPSADKSTGQPDPAQFPPRRSILAAVDINKPRDSSLPRPAMLRPSSTKILGAVVTHVDLDRAGPWQRPVTSPFIGRR